MKDAGFIQIVKVLLAHKSRKQALAYIEEKVGDDYRPLSEQLAHRIEYKRTEKQNNLIHQWFNEIADFTGEDEEWVKAREKYEVGLPILFEDEPDEIEAWKRFMAPLDYEARIWMMHRIPLTSLLNTKQCGRFSEKVEQKWRARGTPLTIPKVAE